MNGRAFFDANFSQRRSIPNAQNKPNGAGEGLHHYCVCNPTLHITQAGFQRIDLSIGQRTGLGHARSPVSARIKIRARSRKFLNLPVFGRGG
jgi:hypothetical protein